MRLKKTLKLLLVGSSMFVSLLAQAREELVYCLTSLNSQIQMQLVQKRPDGKHKILIDIKRDMTKDKEYSKLSGNIAIGFTKNGKGNSNPIAIVAAKKIIQEVLDQQGGVLDREMISSEQAQYSFIYAVAGLEAIDMDNIFDTKAVKKAIKDVETTIKEMLTTRNIELQHYEAVEDSELIYESMKLIGVKEKENIVVHKSTYDEVSFWDGNQLKTTGMKIPESHPTLGNKVYSGSVYSLGSDASDSFFNKNLCNPGPNDYAISIRENFSHYMKTQHGRELTHEDMMDQYSSRKSRNELGSAFLSFWLIHEHNNPHFDCWFKEHMELTMQPTISEIGKILKEKQEKETKPIKVIFMGEYTNILEIAFIKNLIKNKLRNAKIIIISPKETRELSAMAAVSILQKLTSTNQVTDPILSVKPKTKKLKPKN